jgi:multidrug resistance efflux pump
MTAPAPSAAPAAPAGARRIWFEGTALALAAAALAVGAGFLPRGGGIRPLPERATALPVQAREVALVERYEREQSYWGEVRARRSSALSFERAATVVTVAVDEGQAVRAGELLAELDRGGLEAQLAAQDAGLEAARARLAELRAGPRREQLAAARARLAQRSAAVDLARALEGRRRLLRDSDAVALEELEAAELERAALEASAEEARQQLAELEAGTRAEQLAAQVAAVEEFAARRAEVAHDLERSALRAPFDGVVSRVTVEVGAVSDPGAPAVELLEASGLEVWVGLPEGRAATLSSAEPLPLRIAGLEHRARLLAVLPELDAGTRTQLVRLALEQDRLGPTVPGQVAELRLPETLAEGGLWLGADSLVRSRRGLWAAYVLVPLAETAADAEELPLGATHRLVRRELETLATAGERVLVRGDLAPGELVLDGGAQRVTAGQWVRLARQVDGESAAEPAR